MKIKICDKKAKNMTKFEFCEYRLELNHCILISIREKRVVLNFYASAFCFSSRANLTKKMQKMAEKIAFTQKVTELF